ncbi:helix-turn-helix transcriptional regulator [Thermoclostridium stercorarium]|uniref:helix-turn-helix domain-containing protein n=1 Tax=Thermoclostridium stercorarium TaxID=1510 RepID=UPI002248C4A9|nr:helix-turn-helix transcriptional regulator [Thermoclostridium stercorarium]UZQ85076.1 helix-turn-helix transcriptional regulator [Thermoclostridium stercorarium]
MKRTCENIYKNARQSAGLTQEQAAALLNVSPRTLSEYESGRIIPADDIVCKMVVVYKAKHLAYLHLKQSTEVGRRFLPELHILDLPRSVLKLQKEVKDVTDIHSEIVDVACDGEIEEHERETWGYIEKEILEMVGAGLSVIFAKG